MVAEDVESAPTSSSSSSSSSSHYQRQSPSSQKSTSRGRSCRGFLYDSSDRRAKSRNPLCVGFSRPENRAHNYSADRDASKDGRTLIDFKYMCMGYSAHPDLTASVSQNDPPKHAELPLCVGFELLAERRASQQNAAARQAHTPQNVGQRNNEDATPSSKPTSTIRSPGSIRGYSPEEFSARFIRNAGLIAVAVGNNLSRVASSVKSGLDDILFPDRRRPK